MAILGVREVREAGKVVCAFGTGERADGTATEAIAEGTIQQ